MKKIKRFYFGLTLTMLILFNFSIAKAETYKYDNLNRVLSLTYDNGDIVQYNYDNGGNLLSTARIDHVNVTMLVVNSSQVTLKVGSSYKLLAAATFKDNKTYDITKYATYAVSDQKVATVDNTGVIRGSSEGQTSVEVSYADKKTIVNVTIANEKKPEVKTTEPKQLDNSTLPESKLIESDMVLISDNSNASSSGASKTENPSDSSSSEKKNSLPTSSGSSNTTSSASKSKTNNSSNETKTEEAKNSTDPNNDSKVAESNVKSSKDNTKLIPFAVISGLALLGLIVFIKKR